MSDLSGEQSVWIKTEPSVDGSTYVVTIEASEDRSIVLTPTRAMNYASEVLGAVARAEFDAAVVAQLQGKLGLDLNHVGRVVVDLREDRTPANPAWTEPLRIDPGVNQQGEAFLTVSIDDKPVGQWTSADAREHALKVLEAVTVADLDAGYYRVLRGAIGAEEAVARNVVDDLQNYRK